MVFSTTREVSLARKMATKKQVFDFMKDNIMAIVEAIGLGPLNVQIDFPFQSTVSLIIRVRKGWKDRVPKEILINIDGEHLAVDFEVSEDWPEWSPLPLKKRRRR
jgi:hypothetical protein